MTAPVDVLAEFELLRTYFTNRDEHDCVDRLRPLRASVSELIKSAETILDPNTTVGVNAQYERLSAAVSRCKGGA
jgi:hypothetical protein